MKDDGLEDEVEVEVEDVTRSWLSSELIVDGVLGVGVDVGIGIGIGGSGLRNG